MGKNVNVDSSSKMLLASLMNSCHYAYEIKGGDWFDRADGQKQVPRCRVGE